MAIKIFSVIIVLGEGQVTARRPIACWGVSVPRLWLLIIEGGVSAAAAAAAASGARAGLEAYSVHDSNFDLTSPHLTRAYFQHDTNTSLAHTYTHTHTL